MTQIIKIKNTNIYIGDALQSLKQMPDESVNCCVTSPPYWGLRDYGTAAWEGGKQACDHIESEIRTGQGLEKFSKDLRGGGKKQGQINSLQFKSVCQKCGAARVDKQLGLEKTPEEFVENLVEVFREVKRVLRKDGTCWVNLGDSYISNPNPDKGDRKYMKGRARFERPNTKKINLMPKNLVGIPWRVAFALQADGWYLRQDIIWQKPNPMPESVTDRCTKSHEYLFLLSKSKNYFYDHEAIKEPCNPNTNPKISKAEIERISSLRETGNTSIGCNADFSKTHHIDGMVKSNKSYENAVCLPTTHRNKRSVWTIATKPYKGAHFATFPPALVEPCILAGCPKGGVVLDCFGGSGTTAFVANGYNRKAILCELNPANIPLIKERFGIFQGEESVRNEKSLFDKIEA